MSLTQLLIVLFQNYEKQDQKERYDIYVALLKDIPIELLQKAIMKCMKEKKFMPSVAEIREECKSIAETVESKPKFKEWDTAWEEIYKGWCEGSPYKPKPQWSTPEIAKAVESFGWTALLEAQSDHTETIRAQMKVIYEMICKRKLTTEKNTNILLGKSEFENVGKLVQNFISEKTLQKPVKTIENRSDDKCTGARP